ncbi:MAG TPA: glucose-6-phosphate isomerase [Bacteroidales bacterium]|nr:glucose-6-phosphate isomerase [Bacteroidales bacterium]
MENIKLNIDKTFDFVSRETVYGYEKEINKHMDTIHDKTGAGSDFLGWLHLPSSITEDHIEDIEATAAKLKKKADVVVVVGIGGSYLGAKAINEALSHSFNHLLPSHEAPLLLFAGNNLSEDYHAELFEILENKKYAIVVISKSGTTTEPAVAFRLLKNHLEEKVGKEESRELIVAVTDKSHGALRQLSDTEGYKTFVIPDDVGGRYSVLTPVGLLPLAVGGFNIRQLIEGMRSMEKLTDRSIPFADNPAALYAAARNALYRSGKKTEILVNYMPKLRYLSEWWKQLYGESEGKEHKGIFPASVNFTTDLHSMGQFIQEGERNLFEIVLSVQKPAKNLEIPVDPDNLDGLNFLASQRYDKVNKMAELGTMLAHVDGGVPNIHIEIPELTEYYLGQVMYFFEKACAISGYTLGINPFNQPGVEAYKKNMFALLEKPGYEEETKKINEKIK